MKNWKNTYDVFAHGKTGKEFSSLKILKLPFIFEYRRNKTLRIALTLILS